MLKIEISKEPTELYKILKFESLVASGGEAKTVIANGLVSVNGQIETRKRKKIVSGDTIEFAGETFSIVLNTAANIATTHVEEISPAKEIKRKTKPELNLSSSSKKNSAKRKSSKKKPSKRKFVKK
jgi:ribosome-associated protein